MYYEIACIRYVSKRKWYILCTCSEQARWARSAGNSTIENVCIFIIIKKKREGEEGEFKYFEGKNLQICIDDENSFSRNFSIDLHTFIYLSI